MYISKMLLFYILFCKRSVSHLDIQQDPNLFRLWPRDEILQQIDESGQWLMRLLGGPQAGQIRPGAVFDEEINAKASL